MNSVRNVNQSANISSHWSDKWTLGNAFLQMFVLVLHVKSSEHFLWPHWYTMNIEQFTVTEKQRFATHAYQLV